MSAPTQVACAKDARFKRLLAIAATGEIIVDKLPFTGARISPTQLFGRTVSGAVSAVYACDGKEGRWSKTELALMGAAGAVAASYATYYLRKWLVESLELPDSVVAIAEDALVLGAGAILAA